MINTIVFDIGDVLMENADSWSSMYRSIPKVTGLTNTDLDTIWTTHWQKVATGKEYLSDFFKDVTKSSKKNVTVNQLLELYNQASIANPQSTQLIQDLKKLGYRIIVLSNDSHEGIKMRIEKFVNSFDKIYVSATIGLKKPNPEIFDYLLEEEKSIPNEMLFIDDREANIEAAKQFGINTILFTNIDQLQKDLKPYLETGLI